MAFATADDVETRLGAEFTETQRRQVELLLDLVAGLIAGAAGKDADWIRDLSPVPPELRTLSIEVTVRTMQNPTSAARVTETLGAYSHSESYDAGAAGISLTAEEDRMVRRAVFGSNTAGVVAETMADDLGAAYRAPGVPATFPTELYPEDE